MALFLTYFSPKASPIPLLSLPNPKTRFADGDPVLPDNTRWGVIPLDQPLPYDPLFEDYQKRQKKRFAKAAASNSWAGGTANMGKQQQEQRSASKRLGGGDLVGGGDGGGNRGGGVAAPQKLTGEWRD